MDVNIALYQAFGHEIAYKEMCQVLLEKLGAN